MRNLIAGICTLLAFLVNLNARAATVVSVNGDLAGGGGLSLAYDYGADPYTSLLAVGWTSSLNFSDVTITAQVASNNPVGATGEAFLTTEIGTGATVSNEVAETSFVFPDFNGTFSGQLTLFSGLSLSAGTTYFLTIAPDAGFTAGWADTQDGTISSDDPNLTVEPGTTGYYSFVNDPPYTNPGPGPAAFIPASAFVVPGAGEYGSIEPNLIYSVNGTVVPESSPFALLGVGFCITFICLRYRRERARKPFKQANAPASSYVPAFGRNDSFLTGVGCPAPHAALYGTLTSWRERDEKTSRFPL